MAKRKRKQKAKKVTGCTKIEMSVEKMLKELRVPYQHDAAIGKYRVDFLVNNKVIVECYGDYFHCNPTYYDATYYNKALKMEAQGKWSKDANRQHALQSMGYRFYALWETDIKKKPAQYIKSIIKSIISQR